MQLNANGTTSVKPKIVDGYFGLNLVPINHKQFVTEVNRIAKKLGIASNWLLIAMWKESTLQTTAVNKLNGASGLLQWTRSTAKGLGTSVEAIRKMNYMQQLALVERYFTPYKKYLRNYLDLYLVVFLPKALTMPTDWKFAVPGVSNAELLRLNPIDYDKNGYLDRRDFATYVYKGLPTDALKLVGGNSQPGPGNNYQAAETERAANMLPGVEVTAKRTYYSFAVIMGALALAAYNQK